MREAARKAEAQNNFMRTWYKCQTGRRPRRSRVRMRCAVASHRYLRYSRHTRGGLRNVIYANRVPLIHENTSDLATNFPGVLLIGHHPYAATSAQTPLHDVAATGARCRQPVRA